MFNTLLTSHFSSEIIRCLCAVRTQILFLLPYNTTSTLRGCFLSLKFNCLSSVSRDGERQYPAALCSAAAGVILLSFVAMKVNFCRIRPYLSKAVYRIILNWHP